MTPKIKELRLWSREKMLDSLEAWAIVLLHPICRVDTGRDAGIAGQSLS
jgi:hypothetical protein